MKAVIYARYSSDNQREESIEGQLRECLAFANKIGVTVIEHYIDRALTAKTDNRPDFQRMIRDSAKRCFDMVIVWKLDRFSRDRYDSAHYKHLLKKNGVKVVSAIVQYMLSNRRYIGDYKYADIVIPDATPAIIDKGLFERVQQRLKANRHAPARHKAEDDYLLTTKLFCGKCGAYMVGESGTSRTGTVHHYYKCVKAKKHLCDKKTVRKEWIEDIAVRKALEILNDEQIIEYLVDRIFDLQMEENPRLPKLREQLADIEKRIGNVMQAIEQGMLTETTRERLFALEKEKREIDLTIVQEQIKKPFLTKEQIRFGIERFKYLDISTKEGKQRLIDGFINAIYLYDDKITFTFNYKDGTKTVKLSEMEETSLGSGMECIAPPTK